MAFFTEAPSEVSCPECRRRLTDNSIRPGGKAIMAAEEHDIPVTLGQTAEFPFGSQNDSLTHAKVPVWGKYDQPEDAILWWFHAII